MVFLKTVRAGHRLRGPFFAPPPQLTVAGDVMSVCLYIGRICVKIKTFVLLLAAIGEDIQHEGL